MNIQTNNDELRCLFLKLDLEPGCPIASVNERYRVLASLFHPDQMLGAKRKEAAEREMKRLNDIRDKILAHLKGPAHNLDGECCCRKAASSKAASTTATQSRPTTRQTEVKKQQPQAAQPSAPAEGMKAQQHQTNTRGEKSTIPKPDRSVGSNSAPVANSNSNSAPAPNKKSFETREQEVRKAATRQPTYDAFLDAGHAFGQTNSYRTSQHHPIKKTDTTSSTISESAIPGHLILSFTILCITSLLIGMTCNFFDWIHKISMPAPTRIVRSDKAQVSEPNRRITTYSIGYMPPPAEHIDPPALPSKYLKDSAELASITSADMVERTRTLTREFHELLNQIQQPEAFSQSNLSGRIPSLYKRFNFVDNQKTIFENELRRRGIAWRDTR